MRKELTRKMRDRARKLRRDPTPAEHRLWKALRELKRQGFHFRRQAPLGKYILDFVEHGRRLVVEIDGETHVSADDRLRDAERDRVLTREGYRVLRFWNAEVHESVDGVVRRILAAIENDPPP